MGPVHLLVDGNFRMPQLGRRFHFQLQLLRALINSMKELIDRPKLERAGFLKSRWIRYKRQYERIGGGHIIFPSWSMLKSLADDERVVFFKDLTNSCVRGKVCPTKALRLRKVDVFKCKLRRIIDDEETILWHNVVWC